LKTKDIRRHLTAKGGKRRRKGRRGMQNFLLKLLRSKKAGENGISHLTRFLLYAEGTSVKSSPAFAENLCG